MKNLRILGITVFQIIFAPICLFLGLLLTCDKLYKDNVKKYEKP